MAFQPSDIPGLVLWIDPTDQTSYTLSGSTITTITDKASSYAFTNTVGTPLLYSNAFGTANMMYFTSALLTNSTLSFPNNEYTTFAVTYLNNQDGSYKRALNGIPDASFFLGVNGQNVATFTGNGSIWNDTNVNTPSYTNLGKMRVITMAVDTAGTLTPYVDGVAQDTKTGTTGALTDLYIGGSAGAGQGWDGVIGDILIYNSSLTLTNISTVTSYLANKYLDTPSAPTNVAGDVFGIGSWTYYNTSGSSPTRASVSATGEIQLVAAGNIFRSTDYGQSFTSINPGQSAGNVAISANGAYVIASGTDILISSDGGQTYTASGFSISAQGLAISQTGQYQSACVYGGGNIWRSTNYGVTWTDTGQTAPSFWSISMNASGQYQVAGSVYEYIYVSSNYGATWTAKLTDTGRNWYNTAVSDSGQYMTAACGDGGDIFTSSDYGSTWTQRTFLAGQFNGSLTMSGSGQYQAIVKNSTNGEIWISSNYGVTWVYGSTPTADIGTHNLYGVAMSKDAKYMVVAVYFSGLYTTNTNFLSWTAPIQPVSIYNIYYYNGSYNLYASTANTYIAYSNLPPSTLYQYAVKATNLAGSSAYSALSDYINTGGGGITPLAPTNLIVGTDSLLWTAPVSGANSYNVYSYSNTAYSKVASSITTTSPFTQLVQNSSLPYAVTTISTGIESAYSANSSTITISPRPIQTAPGFSTNTLNWSPSPDTVDFYDIYRFSANTYSLTRRVDSIVRNVSTTQLSQGTFQYAIRAVSQFGESGYSALSPFITATTTPPSPPTSVIGVSSIGQLQWTGPPTGGAGPIQSYFIYSLSSSFYNLITSTTTSSLSYTYFSTNTYLPYSVTATNVIGESGYSVASDPIPIAPLAPSEVAGDGSYLSWVTPSTGADFYNVYSYNGSISTLYLSNIASTSVLYGQLYPGTTDYVVTAAGTNAGESVPSAASGGVTVSFAQVPDGSIPGQSFIGTSLQSTTGADLATNLQENVSKFSTAIIQAGLQSISSILDPAKLAPTVSLSTFTDTPTTFLAISSGTSLEIPTTSLPPSGSLLYLPASDDNSYTLTINTSSYTFAFSTTNDLYINSELYILGSTLTLGPQDYLYAAKGSGVLLGTGPPAPPTNVRGDGTNIRWNIPTGGVTSYDIYSYNGTSYTFLATTANNFYPYSSLAVNSGLRYAVKATNDYGTSGYSALTASIYIPPAAPTSLVANGSSLSWTAPAGPIQGYSIYYYVFGYYTLWTTTAGTSIPYSSLALGSFQYAVRAVSANGTSVLSALSDSITNGSGNNPGVPRIRYRPDCADQKITLWWQAPLSDGGSPIFSYTITCPELSLTRTIYTGFGRYTFTAADGIVNNTPYTFSIYATNGFGNGPAATFYTVQAGNLPAPPSSYFLWNDGSLGWDIPSNTSQADLYRNLQTAIPLNDQGQTVFFPQNGQGKVQSYAWSRTRPMGPVLNTASNYQTFVQSINDPGYSAKTAPIIIQNILPSSFVSSCSLWLDARDVSTIELNLEQSSINTWHDKSGSANDVNQYYAPLYIAEPVYGVSFQGNGSLIGPDTVFPAGNSPYSLFTVATIPSSISTQYLFYLNNTTDGIKISSLQFIDSMDPANSGSIGYIGTNQKIIFETIYTTSTHIQRLNGVEFSRSNSSGHSLIQSDFLIGGDPAQTMGLVGDLHEILFFSSVLSEKDLNSLEFYLKKKWNIQTYNPTDTSLDGNSFPCNFWLDMTDTRTWTTDLGGSISTIQDKSLGAPLLLNGYVSTPTDVRSFPLPSTSIYGKSTLFFDGAMGILGDSVKGNIRAMYMIGIQGSQLPEANQNQTVLGHETTSFWSAGPLSPVSSIASATVKSASTLIYNGYGYQVTTAGSNSSWGIRDQPFLLSMASLNGTDTQFNGLGFDRITEQSGFFGDIGEIICFSSTLTQSQQKTVENYLIAKWGIWKADSFF